MILWQFLPIFRRRSCISTLNKSAVPVTSSSQHLKRSALSSLYSNRIATVVASFFSEASIQRYFLKTLMYYFKNIFTVVFNRTKHRQIRAARNLTYATSKQGMYAFSVCSLRSFAPYICLFLTFLSPFNAAFCLLSVPSFFVIRNYWRIDFYKKKSTYDVFISTIT